MKITSYGLFWRSSEIEWNPGQGRRDFRLLGRVGANRGTIQIADFRHQQGIYILYDEYGPSYVGLTRSQGLGKRLKDHLTDNLADTWDRFSWFGFRPLGAPNADTGIQELNEPDNNITENTHTTIADLEALLIRAIGPRNNRAWMNFQDAEEWTQIEYEMVDTYLSRLID